MRSSRAHGVRCVVEEPQAARGARHLGRLSREGRDHRDPRRRRSADRRQINALGFCVGGTLIANALAVMARGEEPLTSLTMMTALLDFEDAGVLDVFIDEAQVRLREQQFARGGIMPGLELGNTFTGLRPNDLVWNYVVSNYLEGKSPPAFDLLYWNGDSTNLPGRMYAWYLRNMYREQPARAGAACSAASPSTLADPGADVRLLGEGRHRAGKRRTSALACRRRAAARRAVCVSWSVPAGTLPGRSIRRRRTSAATAGDDDTLPANSDAWFNSAVEQPAAGGRTGAGGWRAT